MPARLMLIALVLLFALAACQSKEEQRLKLRQSLSTESIRTRSYSPEELARYREKIDGLHPEPQIHSRKKLSQYKMELLLKGLEHTQEALRSFRIPLLSPLACYTLERSIESYHAIDRLNDRLEKNTGMKFELDEDRAELGVSVPF